MLEPAGPMQRAGRALADNWRLLVFALIVGATSFAGAFVLSAQSDAGDGSGTGGAGAGSATQQPLPARTPRSLDVRLPARIGSLNQLYEAAVDVVGGEPPAGGGYPDYAEVASANGEIRVEVPVVWARDEAPPWLNSDDEPIGVSVLATPEVTRFYQAWDTPGLFVGASSEIADDGPESLLDAAREFHEQNCLEAGGGSIDTDAYIGRYEIWYECGQQPTVVLNVAMQPRDTQGAIAAIYMKLVTPYDLGALERALETLEVAPEALD